MKQQIQDRLEKLRTLYAGASPEYRVVIRSQAHRLKAGEIPTDHCYTCLVESYTPEHHPFCSATCHEEWASVNYQNAPHLGRPTIEDCQRRIREIIKERHVKRQLNIA